MSSRRLAGPLLVLLATLPWACTAGVATDPDGTVVKPAGGSGGAGGGGGATSTPPGTGVVSPPPPLPDSGPTSTDAATGTDGATSTDSSATGDAAGFKCGATGGTYDDATKACGTVADCATVPRGCYCGSQPVIGVNKGYLAAALACETKVAGSCPFGCVSGPGRVAEDLNYEGDGGTIKVKCDLGKCHVLPPVSSGPTFGEITGVRASCVTSVSAPGSRP